MALSKTGNPDQQWRDKYLALHAKHEQLKLQTGDKTEQLRRGLVMVSLLAEGQSSKLDTSLTDLREAIKGTPLGMSSKLSDLESSIMKFDAKYDANASELASEISKMAEQLCHCPLPQPVISNIRNLRKNAPQALSSWDGYATQLQGWAGILSAIAGLEGNNESAEKAGGKWFKRWFSKEEENPDTPREAVSAENLSAETTTQDSGASTHSQTPARAVDQIPVVASKPQDSTESEPGFSCIAAEIAETLGGLISRLVIPERLAGRSTELLDRLNDGLHSSEFVALLEDTSQFLLDCLGSGQEEFERFLQSLDKRLQAIQLMVADANTSQNDREQARTDLETNVRDQIADIRSVVNGLGDLGELGSSVRDHLATIVQAMENYQQAEAQRELRLAEQLQVLQARLNEMEAEASQARKIIEDQKTRATQDHLTGLPNRAAYEVRLSEELLKRSRTRSPLSIIVCDVDHFKRINDTYGHIAGDKVLQLLSSTVRRNLRNDDFISRYGGEEFVALLPNTTADDAMGVAEKLRQKVEACPFNFRGERVTITMSFGISEFRSLEAPETVFERTDKALYKAKGAGRNRCVKA
jgi:diguanylate cyclase